MECTEQELVEYINRQIERTRKWQDKTASTPSSEETLLTPQFWKGYESGLCAVLFCMTTEKRNTVHG